MALLVFCWWASQKTRPGSRERAREQTRDPSSVTPTLLVSPCETQPPSVASPSSSSTTAAIVVVCRRVSSVDGTGGDERPRWQPLFLRVAVPEAPGAAQASSLELASLHLCPLDGLLGYAPLRILSPSLLTRRLAQILCHSSTPKRISSPQSPSLGAHPSQPSQTGANRSRPQPTRVECTRAGVRIDPGALSSLPWRQSLNSPNHGS